MWQTLAFVLLVALTGTAGAQSAVPKLSAIVGAWKVIGVKLRPAPVQTLQENDPAYMGALLDISKERLQWRPQEGGTLGDICDRPRLAEKSIQCGSGEFGPPGAAFTMSNGDLVLRWYDNADLILRRVP